MPGQRMLHPEQGTSRKVTALTDFEYRVWEQTKLSSDDFGVMPYTAAVLRADNLRLLASKESIVFAALKRIVALGLLLVWEHQDISYVCAPVWQTWQQIRFPRKTSRPKPPAETLETCDGATRELFRKHPGGRTKDSGQLSDKVPSRDGDKSGHTKDSGQLSDKVPSRDGDKSGHPEPQVPASASASANANGRSAEETKTPRRFDRSHATHVSGFCQFKCLSDEKINQFAKDLPRGLDDPKNFDRVLTWAEHLRDTWGDAPKREADWWKFWEARWAEQLTVAAPEDRAHRAAVASTTRHLAKVAAMERGDFR